MQNRQHKSKQSSGAPGRVVCGFGGGGRRTPYRLGPIRQLLDILLGQHAEHDNAVHPLLEPLLGLRQRLGVNEAAVDFGPAGSGGDTRLRGLESRKQGSALLSTKVYGAGKGRKDARP